MTTTSIQKQVITRKPHRCWGCWKGFPEKSEMTCTTTFSSEGIDTTYTCQHCENWIKKNTQDWDWMDWESMMPGHIGYWKDGQWYPQEK